MQRGIDKAQKKRDQVHATQWKKQLKQQSNTKWNLPSVLFFVQKNKRYVL